MFLQLQTSRYIERFAFLTSLSTSFENSRKIFLWTKLARFLSHGCWWNIVPFKSWIKYWLVFTVLEIRHAGSILQKLWWIKMEISSTTFLPKLNLYALLAKHIAMLAQGSQYSYFTPIFTISSLMQIVWNSKPHDTCLARLSKCILFVCLYKEARFMTAFEL